MLLKRNQASLGISNSFLAHMHTHTHPKPGKTPGGALLLDPGLSCLYFTRESFGHHEMMKIQYRTEPWQSAHLANFIYYKFSTIAMVARFGFDPIQSTSP